MLTTFAEVREAARALGRKKLAVAAAQDGDVLRSVDQARREGIVEPLLVGDAEQIARAATGADIPLDGYDVIDVKDPAEACREAAAIVSCGKADLLMKGFIDTSVLLKAVLAPEYGLRTGHLLSHVGVLSVAGIDRLLYVTDSAMAIAPDLKDKAAIIENAVKVAHALGNSRPKVAALCAVEKVNPKMPCTVDAQELTAMNQRGEITGCVVQGPLALDNAVSPQAAKHKGVAGEVAGCADILLVPDIEAGNLLNKSMEYFAHAQKAGVIVGARVPVVLTSRASSAESKLNSIALGVLTAEER